MTLYDWIGVIALLIACACAFAIGCCLGALLFGHADW